MANEGVLGKTKISGQRAATDDHPAIIHALPLDESVTAPLAVGTLLRRVDITQEINEVNVVIGFTFKPWGSADTFLPCAVVDKPCDPGGEPAETSAICLVHGTVKTSLLQWAGPANLDVVVEILKQSGIYAV
ncbi:MAG: hypothetical protein LBJ14_10330 [Desulfarculales bacterium]|jgi:hypothetical protein|nr:hypothetical protein [Desulfarculales bacterium]